MINASELAERIAEKKAEFSSQLEKTARIAGNYEGMRAELENAWMNLKTENISRFVKRPILLENV